MARAVEYAKISAPGADGFVVLVGHDARDLMQMRQIVANPGGQEL